MKAAKLDQVSDARKKILWQKYLTERNIAEEMYKKINYNTVQNMTDEELINLYSSKKTTDGIPDGLGYRNKLAYANVIRPIVLEIAKRAGLEQSNLGVKTQYEGKDLGFFHSWLMSNNIPSNQPEIQALVRKMEIEHKKFLGERAIHVGRINKVTDELYQEVFGYKIVDAGISDIAKSVKKTMFMNREEMYKKLYGSLVVVEKIIDDTTGNAIDNMRYKNEDEIRIGIENGTISPAQLNFYKVTKEVTEYLKPFALQNGNEGRTDYIPHSAPAMMEVKSRRGMLGLAINSKTIDERIYDVTMSFVNPLNKTMEQDVSFKYIKDVYKKVSKYRPENRGNDMALAYTKLKRKAIILAKKGQNENGSRLLISNVEIGSAIGDVFMDRFSSSRSVSATDLPTMDLNKAFVDYTHGVLFNSGNENFQGFNKMLPLVDGILALTEERGDVNANRYVQKVWKDYFLGGKKQDILPNNSTLEAIGLSTDKVVSFITKASLIYWLGWKGLVLGLGKYAIGNVLVGKYTNIKNAGGKNWIRGEQRFWKGMGKFDITNPFRGVQESVKILYTAGFMDINVYDDVNMQEKNSGDKHFTNLALLPMIWSEKWIQGVDFLGRLSQEQYDILKSGQRLDPGVMAELENEIKNSHGKGYQPTDQRMIQMYSWGSNMMQFSRYIPTMFYDQFHKKDIDIYGKTNMGSYYAVGKTIQKGIRGDWNPKTFMEYRKNLNVYERRRLDQGLVGFGMLAGLVALGVVDSKYANDGLIADANPLLDTNKMWHKITTTPSMDMISNFIK